MIKALVKLGVLSVNYDYEYVGPVGTPERKKVDLDRISNVQFGLSAEEWCELCMREGRYYMGGCCGQTSAIQDIFSSVFRDGGWANGWTIRELMESAARHEGFETYAADFDKKKLPGLLKRWKKLDPIQKIGVMCQAVKDKLKTDRLTQPRTRPEEPDDFVMVLEHSLSLLSYRDVFRDEKDKESSQHHANQELLLAKAVPAAKKFLEASIPFLSKPFEGVAIVKKGTTEIQQNRLGFCVYRTEKEAQDMVDLWKKSRDEARDDEKAELSEHIESIEILPVAISADGGIVWPKAALERRT